MSPALPRRGFLSGLAALPLIGGGITLPGDAAAATPVLADLWRNLLVARGGLTAAGAAQDAATERLPWWAKAGPNMVDHEGNFSGRVTGSPAMKDYTLPEPGVFRMIRTCLYDIDRHYPEDGGFWGKEKTRRDRQRCEALLAERVAAQQVEFERVGLPALNERYERACDAWSEAEEAVLSLTSDAPDVVAGHIILTTIDEGSPTHTANTCGTVAIAAMALRGFLPFLVGDLAVDATEFVVNPDRELRLMRASQGIEIDGSRVLI